MKFETKEKARKVLFEIRNYIWKALKLELNSKTAYFKEKQGINFLDYRIWKTHLLIRNQSNRIRKYNSIYKFLERSGKIC